MATFSCSVPHFSSVRGRASLRYIFTLERTNDRSVNIKLAFRALLSWRFPRGQQFEDVLRFSSSCALSKCAGWNFSALVASKENLLERIKEGAKQELNYSHISLKLLLYIYIIGLSVIVFFFPIQEKYLRQSWHFKIRNLCETPLTGCPQTQGDPDM